MREQRDPARREPGLWAMPPRGVLEMEVSQEEPFNVPQVVAHALLDGSPAVLARSTMAKGS